MAYATGKRILAAALILMSAIPPWIQAVLTLPLGLFFLWHARKHEERVERDAELTEKQLEQLDN